MLLPGRLRTAPVWSWPRRNLRRWPLSRLRRLQLLRGMVTQAMNEIKIPELAGMPGEEEKRESYLVPFMMTLWFLTWDSIKQLAKRQRRNER